MAFQSFSPKMHLAKALIKAKGTSHQLASPAEKERSKQVTRVRNAKRLSENLAQRALIEGKRT
jgi:hypothetical protein